MAENEMVLEVLGRTDDRWVRARSQLLVKLVVNGNAARIIRVSMEMICFL